MKRNINYTKVMLSLYSLYEINYDFPLYGIRFRNNLHTSLKYNKRKERIEAFITRTKTVSYIVTRFLNSNCTEFLILPLFHLFHGHGFGVPHLCLDRGRPAVVPIWWCRLVEIDRGTQVKRGQGYSCI